MVSLPSLRAWAPGARLLVLGAALGCTEFADGSDELDAPLTAVMSATPDEWACLSDERPPTPAVALDRNRPLTYRGIWLDLGTGAPPPNLRARACGITDPACGAPLTAFIAADANGLLELPLFHGFSGFLEITSDVTVPVLAFFTAAFTANEGSVATEFIPRTLIQPTAVVDLARLNGIEVDPATGYVAIYSLDCAGTLAENVAFSLDNQRAATRFYFANQFPSITLEATTPDGLGGFVNVSSGAATVSATLIGTGELVRTASLFLRAGWGATVVLGPYAGPDR